jgi:hypothetical protein
MNDAIFSKVAIIRLAVAFNLPFTGARQRDRKPEFDSMESPLARADALAEAAALPSTSSTRCFAQYT